MAPRALPPGPGLSTRILQAKVAKEVRTYGLQVLGALRPLFRDLVGPKTQPRSAAERLAAGGALVLPKPTGGPMSQAELRAWLERAEFPLLRAVDGGFSVTSGADVLARALGGGARSVEVMLRDRGSVSRHELRLVPGITHAQISSRLLDVPEAPRPVLTRDFLGLSAQATRQANAQLAGLDVGNPFQTTPDQNRRFLAAARGATRQVELRSRQARAEMVNSLRIRAEAPRLFDPDRDVGRELGLKLEARAEGRVLVRSEQAARGADQEAHEAEVESTRKRHEKLGINRYMWISSRDERTRKRHLDLDRTVHSWDDPPEADPDMRYHPGERNNCRCTASPLQEDILAALEGE